MAQTLERLPGETRSSGISEQGLVVSVFGAFTASYRGKPIDIKLRKGAAILGYLCLQENFTARRDRLAFLLWSDSDSDSARTSLRQTLITLRRAFLAAGCDSLTTTKIAVSLDRRGISVDLRRLLAATEERRVDEALISAERVPETLLEGMEDLDEEFRTWLLPTRQALNNRIERSLSRWLSDPATNEQSKLQAAAALLRVDPTNEAALRQELLLLSQRGDVAGALRSYRRFETLLTAEYGLKPSPDLQQLIARIQLEGGRSDVAPPVQPKSHEGGFPDRNSSEPERTNKCPFDTISICLKPFVVHGVDSSRRHVATGIRRTLTSCLARFREWVIVDGHHERRRESTSPSICDYTLQGTLYEVDGSIEIVLTLLRARDASYPWSQIIRLDALNWVATQHDIIRGIASALQVHISAERLSRGIDQANLSVTAFDHWLRAQASAFSLDSVRLNEARESLRIAAQTNPTYSPLFSALAQMDNVGSALRPGVFRTQAISQSAIQNARLAVQLDALDSRAHLALAWAYAIAWDFEAAMPHIQLAVELNESDPWPHIAAALIWTLANEKKLAAEGIRNFTRRSRSITIAANIYLAQIHFLNGEFGLALTLFDGLGTFLPMIASWKASAMAHLGRIDEAKPIGGEFLSQARAAWQVPGAPTDEDIVGWSLQVVPLRHFPHWNKLREGLSMAGLPVEAAKHTAFFEPRHEPGFEA